MLTQDRFNIILQVLDQQGSVTVSELSALIGASESTIRRDLTTLSDDGKLKKVFGGATVIRQTEGVFEDLVSNREIIMTAEKRKIAEYAAKLINSDDFVYIDAGTTTSFIPDYISNKRATYVTNGIAHAKKLISKGFKVYTIGGRIKIATEAIVGSEGLRSLKTFNFTKAFMGTNGIDTEVGFTTPDIEEGIIKEEAINKSYLTFILADHTKFRKIYPITFADIKKCCIITDKLPYGEFADKTVVKEVMK